MPSNEMQECDITEYQRVYKRHEPWLCVFSSYSGTISGVGGWFTGWGLDGFESMLIASECESKDRMQDPEAWTYWKNSDVVRVLDELDVATKRMAELDKAPA